MSLLVNEEIRKLNENFSPSGVLEFARKLNSDTEMTTRLGETAFAEAGFGIDRKLMYPSIRFDDLQLKKFPELPSREMVHPRIVEFCGQVYRSHKGEIRRLIANLKTEILRCET
jgi:hypothetical protein